MFFVPLDTGILSVPLDTEVCSVPLETEVFNCCCQLLSLLGLLCVPGLTDCLGVISEYSFVPVSFLPQMLKLSYLSTSFLKSFVFCRILNSAMVPIFNLNCEVGESEASGGGI